MNILLINHYAGAPDMGMEFRPFYMCREWQKMGHKTMIVCASQAHVRHKQFEADKTISQHKFKECEYLVIKTPAYKGNSLKRVLNILAFVWRLYKNKKRLSRYFKPDVVIASSTYPLDIYPARQIAKLNKAKLIYEVHDLWPLSPMELGGYSKYHPFIWLMQRAEDYAYKYSDKVVSMLPNALDHMREHGLAAHKFAYVPNGIVAEDWDITAEVPALYTDTISREKEKQHKIIAYTGAHGVANALDSLLEAMHLLKDEKVSLLLIGDGPLKEELIEQANALGLDHVFFLPAVPKTLIPSILNHMDILYIGLKKQPLFRFGISPNKLIDYLMSGKPIIQAISAGNDIVSEAGCGYTIAPENPQKIAETVRQMLSLPQKELDKMGQQGKAYGLKNHDYKVLSEKFARIMQEIDKIPQ